MVPASSSPFCARRRAPLTVSSSHEILVPEKYGSSSSPVLRVNFGSSPFFLSFWHIAAVRRSCHTMALWIGLPVALSQTTTVSRWLVMPIAAMSFAVSLALRSAERTVETTLFQISSGSCSTQPESGKCWVNSFWPVATIF